MKYVINNCDGGFGISDEWLQARRGIDFEYLMECDVRKSDAVIKAIENGEDVSGHYANLVVVEIPDEATDWEIQECNGFEEIIYVLDGKIFHL